MNQFKVAIVGLLWAATFAAAPDLSAQLTLGVSGGVVSSTLVGADIEAEDPQSLTGLSLGAYLAIPLAGRVSIVPGGHYVQKGAKSEEAGVGTLEFGVSYFELPVLLSLALTSEDSPVGFSVFAGPSFAFEVGCTETFTDTDGTSDSDDCAPADEDERQTFDVGALFGGTVQFPLTDQMALTVSGGADLGLRTLDTQDDPDDVRNRAFFGSVALAIPLSY